MFHTSRRWCVAEKESPEELARLVTGHSWCLCTGFKLGSYLFLNDSTSEDGAAEYAVVKMLPDGSFIQTESITFGWCDYREAWRHIRLVLDGKLDTMLAKVTPVIETSEAHGRCGHCA